MPNGESFDNDATVLETLWAVEYFPVMFQVVAAKSSFWFFNYLSLFFFHHLHQWEERFSAIPRTHLWFLYTSSEPHLCHL